MIGIITFNAYWHMMKTDPFISVAVVVEEDKKLTEIIAEEVGKKKKAAGLVIARDLKTTYQMLKWMVKICVTKYCDLIHFQL